MARLSAVQADTAPPKNASEALHTQKQEHLECRDLRHPWTNMGAFYGHSPSGAREIHRKLVCERCGVEGLDRWTPKGVRVARQYKYPTGYSVKGVKIKPQDVRREVISRIEIFATEDDMLANIYSGGRRKRA